MFANIGLQSRRAATLVPLLLVVVMTFISPQEARAQWIVFDPTNYMENTLTAIRTLQSNVNEATQISNQIQQINQGVQNLQQLPTGVASSLLGENLTQLTQLASTVSSINGLASNISTLAVQFQTQYPNNRTMAGNLTAADVLRQVNGFLDTARSTTQGAYAVQARVLGSLPNDATSMGQILTQSQASSGNLDAVQATNQMLGQVGMQLVKMNQQIAANNQVQTDWIAQQQQIMDANAKRGQDAMVGWGAPATRTPWTGY